MSGLIERWLFRPVDASSLAVFRILFGALMLFEAVNYGAFLCLDCMYRETDLLFKYHHFEWARLLPGRGLEIVFVVMALAATGVMLGLFYRLSAVLLVLTFGYLFLLDQALYLNHFYLALLFATILIFVPAHRLWSLDARRRPSLASSTVPNWGRFWLGAQLEIVLIHAGLAKLTFDWLNLEPMRLWMNWASADEAAVFQWLTQDPGIALASYGAIALHLLGAPLLLWRRTRLPVLLIYGVFHVINALVFNIGIFPFMTFAATLMLFDADWPRQVLRALNSRGWLKRLERAAQTPPSSAPPAVRWRYAIAALVSMWLVVQVVVPLRHHTLPGNVKWNEDGHRFAWRMKLRSKRGQATFFVVLDDGRRIVVDPSDHLTRKQTIKMACIPDMLWQFAQFLEEKHNEGGRREVAVYADTMCSLNARPPQPLVDRLVDLSDIARDAPTDEWITPLTTRLPDPLF